MAKDIEEAQRQTIVAEWQRLRQNMSQSNFVEHVATQYGVHLSPRTLRTWCRDERLRPEAQEQRMRELVVRMLHRVQSLEEELQDLLDSLPEQERIGASEDAAPAFATPCREANPETETPVEPQTSEQRSSPQKFVWDLE